MKIKCAAFRSMGTTDYVTVFRSYGEEIDDGKYGYIRVSEWLDVEFPELPAAEQASAELSKLDELEQKTRDEFNTKIRAIVERRANIAALSYSPASVVREHDPVVLQ